MFATFYTPADVTFHGFSLTSILDQIRSARAAAEARSRKRRDYLRMLNSDDLLNDIGVTREEVRRALDCMN